MNRRSTIKDYRTNVEGLNVRMTDMSTRNNRNNIAMDGVNSLQNLKYDKYGEKGVMCIDHDGRMRDRRDIRDTHIHPEMGT